MAFCLASCSQTDSPETADQGQIDVSVSANKQLIGSRANDNGETPDANDFGISITSAEGEEVAAYSKLSDFQPFKAKAGTYTVTATYGDAGAEGFDAISFAGSEQVVVKRKETAQATVTCTINKALVHIGYTDDFKKYFTQYDAYIATSKGKEVTYAADESRAAYFVPGNLRVYLRVKKSGADQTVTLNPKDFTAQAQHEYYLSMDVDASSATLTVTFTDELQNKVEEPINVSDAALSAPAPTITAHGFQPNETLEYVEGFLPQDNGNGGKYDLYLHTTTNAIKRVDFTAQSAWWTAQGLPETQDLVALALPTNSEWGTAGKGIVLTGLATPKYIAGVDFTHMLAALTCSGAEAEEHSFALSVTDNMTRVSETVALKVKTLPDELALQPAAQALFGDNKLSAKLTLRGASETDIANRLTYYYKQESDNDFIELSHPVTSVTKGEGANEWNVSLAVADASFAAGNLQLKVVSPVGHSQTADYAVAPDLVLSYNSEGDIWAKKATLQLKPRDKGSFSLAHVKFQYQDTEAWKDIAYTYKENEGFILSGLTPGTQYTVRELYTIGENAYESNTVSFTTEAAAQVDNSGFETWKSAKVWKKTIFLSGGEQIYSYYPYTSNGWWETANGITTQEQTEKEVASWYYCAYPGTLPTNASETHTATWHLNNHDGKSLATNAHSGKAAAEIATIGYGANNWLAFSHDTKYRQAGLLYIGTFDTQSKQPKYGHSFTSRPESVSFYYRFYSYNNETTKAYARLSDKDGNAIGYGELKIAKATDTYTQGTITIGYTNTTAKAASITIVFMSTDAESPATKDIQGSKGAVNAGYGDSRHIGSIFTVDDVTLNY